VNAVWRRPVAALLGAAAIALVAFRAVVAKYSGYDALTAHAMVLVDESFARDEKTFLVITGIKTALAVVEGSEVGVGFELKVGDVVQAPYDTVNFFWDMFLYAFLILGSYRLLLETGMLALGLTVMGIGFAVFAVAVAANAQGRIWRWGRRTLLGGALFAYTVPFALMTTHALSEQYTTAIRERHLEEIRQLSSELDRSKEDFIALKDEMELLHPLKSVEKLKEGMLAIARSMGQTFERTLTAFLYFMLVVAFEVVFFPFLSGYLLYKFGQFAVGRTVLALAATDRY
jgi:hypothetical protein